MKTRVLFVALAIVSAGTLCAQNKVNGCVIDRTDNSKLICVNATLSNDSGQVAGTTTDNNLNSPLTRTQKIRFWNITVR